MTAPLDFQGAKVWKSFISPADQKQMVADLRAIAARAPFRQYDTPGGKKMSVRMSGAGAMAWTSDQGGYQYAKAQPNGANWPGIPEIIMDVWRRVVDESPMPDSCLFNFYGEGSRMGLHQDKDEADMSWPVVSVSLGDDAQFRVGGLKRRDPTKSIWLNSGDVVVLSGASRLAYHGIDRIRFRSSSLLENGGRINITLRVAGSRMST